MFEYIINNDYILIIVSIFFSSIPFIIWLMFFNKIKKANTGLIIKTAIGGVICAIPILILQYFMSKSGHFDFFGIISGQIKVYDIFSGIKSGIDNIFLQTLLIFIVVGILEEYAKHRVVVTVDAKKDNFKSIADAIHFSIVAALGFTLIENAIYFYTILKIENFEGFFIPFIFRSILSVFAHIFFSSVYGYYYGMAVFAREAIVEEIGHHKHFYLLHLISKITKIDMVTLFKDRELLLGLLIAMILHAIFNTLLAFGLIYIAIPFIGFGYIYVMYEFDKRSNYINFKRIDENIKLAIKLNTLKKEKDYIN